VEKINPHRMPDSQELDSLGLLALYLGGSGDSFTGDLLRLTAKADPGNYDRLAAVFPITTRAYALWQSMSAPTVGDLTAALARHGMH